MAQKKKLVGRQYGDNSSALRAIRRFWKKNPTLFKAYQNCLWTNRIDEGCIEIDGNIDV